MLRPTKYRTKPKGSFQFNVKKLEVLRLFNNDKWLRSNNVARALNLSRTNAARTLLHYWRWGFLSRIPYYPGKPGRPPFLYSRTPRGYMRYIQLKVQQERGYPLNLKKYKPVDIGDLEGSDLLNLKDDRKEREDESKN